MEGALDKIAIARGHMERKEYEPKGRNISWAISIVNGLRGSLDLQAGGEIAANLDSLYDYMVRRLTESNLTNDQAILGEVSSLLREIKSAWDAMPDEVKTLPGEPQQPQQAAS
jgi:flagellar protein FliS